MKRTGKVVLGLGAVLAVIGAGAIWLISSAAHVVDDAVDSGISAAGNVASAAHREAASVGREASAQVTGAVASARKTLDTPDKAPSETPTDETTTNAQTEKAAPNVAAANTTVAGNATSAKKANSAKPERETSDLEDLADMGKALLPMLNDSDDASPLDLKAVLSPSEKADADTSGDSDEMTDLIPGAKSPTVKKWLAGKYKGKEGQALEDALDDPQALRAVFFFVGM